MPIGKALSCHRKLDQRVYHATTIRHSRLTERWDQENHAGVSDDAFQLRCDILNKRIKHDKMKNVSISHGHAGMHGTLTSSLCFRAATRPSAVRGVSTGSGGLVLGYCDGMTVGRSASWTKRISEQQHVIWVGCWFCSAPGAVLALVLKNMISHQGVVQRGCQSAAPLRPRLLGLSGKPHSPFNCIRFGHAVECL